MPGIRSMRESGFDRSGWDATMPRRSKPKESHWDMVKYGGQSSESGLEGGEERGAAPGGMNTTQMEEGSKVDEGKAVPSPSGGTGGGLPPTNDGGATRPLPLIATAFQNLAPLLRAGSKSLPVRDFAGACAEVSVLFGHLGMAFKFAEKDYVSKVQSLKLAAAEFDALPSLLDHDVDRDTVRDPGSHTRNLLRVKRGLEMVEYLFQYILEDNAASLADAASHAYKRALAPYHSWAIKKAVWLGMHTLPSRSKFLQKIHEDQDSWKPATSQCKISSATSQCHIRSATSQCQISSATSAVPGHIATSDIVPRQQCHVRHSAMSGVTSDTVPCQQCHVSSTTSDSAASAVPHQQCHVSSSATRRFQARRKEAQDLLQRHEATSIDKLKFWLFEPNGDEATPEEQYKEFLSKLVTRLLYACNYQRSELERQHQDLAQQHQELATLRRTVQGHEDATRALNAQLLNLEQTVPGPAAGASSSAPSSRQLEDRVDHVVAMLGDISTFAALTTTISSQLHTLKTEVQQLQTTNANGNPKMYKMPTFTLEKFDDYTQQDSVLWWEAFTTQLGILPVDKDAYIGVLFMNSKGGCQTWLTHLATSHGVDVPDLKDVITWEELTRLWKKRFIVDDAPALAINRLFTMSKGNTATWDWLTEWQKIAAVPNLNLPFEHLRREFYNRSCAALSQALGDREQYSTFAEIIDKAREIIKTNRLAAHEKSTSWQPTYVEKVRTEDIVSDRDTRFMSVFWTALMQESDTTMKPSSARHPQTDGHTERAHQTAQMMLRTLIRPDQKDWVDRLPDIEFAYNTSVHPAIGVTPFELHHGGRKGRIFADLLLPRPVDIDAACSPASVRKYRELLTQARANMQKSQVRMKQQVNRRRVPCPIRAGDLVWVSAEEFALEQDVSRKLLPKWFGPWSVTAAAGDEPDGPSFVINIPEHLTVHPVFHASKLATYTPVESDDFPDRRSQDPPSMDGHQEGDRVISDRKYGSKPQQYKVTFKACDRDDTRWISGADLKASAPLIYAHYEKRRLAQEASRPAPPTRNVVPPSDRQLRPRR
ncbi:hypothetical protein CBR_g29685 [Chara braunii]|uniref:Integrase catalytic domain-containing protein n=1 Tax=Chara braunii TaxID=69332 RepID=A0A388LB57_CHABU|nr:hypothetical protein CBR_g29685 [Chara braunii]|eukprot:GBG79538.1 hypothetical protein CBR_g29685 [Chara braunii]